MPDPRGARRLLPFDCDVKFNNKEFCASAVAPRSIALQENWLADTGATAHITMSDVGMTNVRPVSVTVVVGDGSEIKCTKRGDIKLTNGEKTMILKDVLYTPKFHKNIVSLGVLIRDGFDLSVTGSTMTVKKGRGGHISFNRETNGVFYYFKGMSINSLESHGVFLLRRRIYYPKLWTSYLSSYLQQNMSSSIYDVIMQVKISKICHLYAPSMVFRLNTQHQIHLSRTVLLSASLSPYVIEAVLL
jgi:hypothetical protein